MRAVAATGYSGPLSLEIFNDQFRSGLPRMVAKDGHRSLIALMDQVRRVEPRRPDLPRFPAPAPVERIEAYIAYSDQRREPRAGDAAASLACAVSMSPSR